MEVLLLFQQDRRLSLVKSDLYWPAAMQLVILQMKRKISQA